MALGLNASPTVSNGVTISTGTCGTTAGTITVTYAGTYFVQGRVSYGNPASVAGESKVWLTQNGTSIGTASTPFTTTSAAVVNTPQANVLVDAVAGDTFAISTSQSSGGALTPTGGNLQLFRLADSVSNQSDSLITSPANGDALLYNSSSSRWKNGSVSSGACGGLGSPCYVDAGGAAVDKINLGWWGIWAIVGLMFVAILAPVWFRSWGMPKGSHKL